MTVKWIGAVLVVLSCGLFGIVSSYSIRLEVAYFRDLVRILNYMESELQYRLTPLPTLCRLSANQGKTLTFLFQTFANELENQVSPDALRCMDAALYQCCLHSKLMRSYLRELGSSFGKFDLNGQLLGIRSIREQCIGELNKLESTKDNRVRNFQTISLCVGVVTIIILF